MNSKTSSKYTQINIMFTISIFVRKPEFFFQLSLSLSLYNTFGCQVLPNKYIKNFSNEGLG